MKKLFIIGISFCVFAIGAIYGYMNDNIFHFFVHSYTNEDFHIKTYLSHIDYNQNGRDDVLDILQGAKNEAKRHPRYHSEYYSGGYPPESEGVCSDVIWRSFKEAGIDLKSLVDNDIKNHLKEYPNIDKPDPNIDFRRVKNLMVFFKRYGKSLTTNPHQIDQWQAGDIVVFSNKHIGIISDLRNKKGVSYIIHNAGQLRFEEDALVSYSKHTPISGHYRFSFNKRMYSFS